MGNAADEAGQNAGHAGWEFAQNGVLESYVVAVNQTRQYQSSIHQGGIALAIHMVDEAALTY